MKELLGLQKKIQGGDLDPLNFLKSQENVVTAELLDIQSSTGDWSGVFVVKEGDKLYAVGFSQEWCGFDECAFTLYTDSEPSAEFADLEVYESVKDDLCRDWFGWADAHAGDSPMGVLGKVREDAAAFKCKIADAIAGAIEATKLGEIELPDDGYEYDVDYHKLTGEIIKVEYYGDALLPKVVDENGAKLPVTQLTTDDLVHLASSVYEAICDIEQATEIAKREKEKE
jgi:hypothetical protein